MKRCIVLAVVVASLSAPGLAQATQTLQRPNHSLYRPNPVFTGLQLEYVRPLTTPSGGVASLVPLSERVTAAAVADMERLAYQRLDDLGGFTAAPLGQTALSSGGHDVVGSTGRAQIPLFQHHAGGNVNAFTFIGSGPPVGPGNTDNGKGNVPGIGVPVPVPPATNNNNVPSANGGFAGQGQGGGKQGGGTTTTGGGHGSGTGTTGTGRGAGRGGTDTTRSTTRRTTTARTKTTRTTTARTTTTQATISTTAPTTTVVTTTEGGGGGGGGSGDCGGDGISIVPSPGSPSDCKMKLFGAKPGDEEHEVLTITNVSDAPYTLALEVTGRQNHLWQDLEMGVWEEGTPTPRPLPPLLWWAGQYSDLVTLQPGEAIVYRIALFLPVEAGNVDQSLTAIINFKWAGH